MLENWRNRALDGKWEVESDEKGPATVHSRCFSDTEQGILLARECILDIPDKFFAETVLVYPQTDGFFPIFGSEYIKMGRGCFGAVDFHPPQAENNEIPEEFRVYPGRIVNHSPHYDLNQHFSPVLWHKKSAEDFYDEFENVAEGRLKHYLAVLGSHRSDQADDPEKFSYFDTYMAVHDPAHGILKAYFGAEFANDYLRRFLFPHCRCDTELGYVQRN